MLPAAFLRKERVLNKHADDAPETGVEVVVGLELDAVVLEDEGESRSAAVLLSKKRYKYPKKKESRSAKVAGAQEHRDVLDDFAMYLRPALELCSKLVCLMLSFLTCCRCRQRERFIDAVIAVGAESEDLFVRCPDPRPNSNRHRQGGRGDVRRSSRRRRSFAAWAPARMACAQLAASERGVVSEDARQRWSAPRAPREAVLPGWRLGSAGDGSSSPDCLELDSP